MTDLKFCLFGDVDRIKNYTRLARREWRKIFTSKNVFQYDEDERRRTVCTSREFEEVMETLLPCKIATLLFEPNTLNMEFLFEF